MVRIGFVVEGDSEKVFVESTAFRQWLNEHGMSLVEPVAVAGGQGRMERAAGKGELGLAALLKKEVGNLDRVVMLADLDPSRAVPCITERKNRINSQAADL